MTPEDSARVRAAFKTGSQNLWNRTDRMTHRMAGGALAAALLPTGLSMVDNQEENLAQVLIAGGLTGGGMAIGQIIEETLDQMSPEEIEEFIQMEVGELKRKSRQDMKTKGVQQANEEFGRAKQKLYEDFEPVDAQPGRREVFRRVTGADLLGKTPRNLRSMTRGALLGGIAAAPLAYGVLRGGEIE
tara:strand:- start:3812 stop:4372 length:561 start_codon:yes stop_codon:yes gene_type:complete